MRLVVQLTNGRTLEERVNFFISRTPPMIDLISYGPAYYGNKTTILAAVRTDEPCVTRMYYRKFGETNFSFVTLDGFTTNNQFVKYYHYGFIPKQLVVQNELYEVYFEAENLVGLKTTVYNNGQNFIFSTNYNAEIAAETLLSYSLPEGSIFEDAVNITSNDESEIFLREFSNSRTTSIYKWNNNAFTFVDTLFERIIKDAGDFNNNGLTDLLALFTRNGYLLEQSGSSSSSFTEKYAQTNGEFWPVFAEDIDGDNITEVLVVDTDTSFKVYNINNDLTISGGIALPNFTIPKYGGNVIDSPNGVVADANGDGTKELWFVDLDGDIFSYNILGPD
ncbi:MAG: hypothetical protein R3321_14495, partial [Nitrososphaeraceae archaeon]|nr:hypothetical protein [Nitrososphaeraceae archaeon]